MPSCVMSTISSSPLVSLQSIRRSPVLDLDGDDAAFPDVFEIAEVRLLHDAAARREDDVQLVVPRFLVGLLALDADGRGDLFLGAQLEQVRDAAAFAGAEPSGISIDALDVTAAVCGEEHQVVVRRRGEEMLDEIVCPPRVAPSRAVMPITPFAAAALGAVGGDGGALDEAVVRDRDDDAFVRDEILDG